MKKVVLVFCLLLLTACASSVEESPLEDGQSFAMFTLNTHDWVFPERSVEAVEKTIDLHEQYGIPVDIYLNDQVVQEYTENYPELIQRLKTSDVVAISYHTRPPMPMVQGFDLHDFEDMDEDELYETLLAYTEHALDKETGLYTDDEGGYQYLKDLMGYPPYAASYSSSPAVEGALNRIYAEKGAVFAIVHGIDVDLGQEEGALYVRPEHAEIKWYEEIEAYRHGDVSAESLILDEMDGKTGIFVNIKMHENNYYTVGTPFWPVYWEDSSKSVPLDPPYDLSAGEENIPIRPDQFQEDMWEWYEAALIYVAENPALYVPVSNADVVAML